MKIDKSIFTTYIDGDGVTQFKDHWIFQTFSQLNKGQNPFTLPTYDDEQRQEMRRIAEEIENYILDFTPNNLDLWVSLFPKHKSITDKITIYFIVGLPPGFDALALPDRNGNLNGIYDIGNWLMYKDMNIKTVAGDLLTHELAHLCIMTDYPSIPSTTINGSYHEKLDAICFNEGFAHLLAHMNMPIDAIDWRSQKYQIIFKNAVANLQKALQETDPQKQAKLVNQAMSGNYQQKFGAMAGMLFLANQFLDKGKNAITEIYRQGYRKFTAEILREQHNR